jgi:L-2,4-diaminobutyric acid acetyltransferase
VVAERDSRVEGWISAYRPPAEPQKIFVWQIAVAREARGAGLGGRMLDELLARPAARGVTALITTITDANHASAALFDALARRHGADIHRQPHFERGLHFNSKHDTEFLISIGPLASI